MRKASRTPRNVRTEIYQPKHDAPKSKRQWRISVFVRPVLYLIVFGVVVYVVIISPVFQIRSIKVKGNSIVASRDIQRAVEGSLSSSPLSRNILFLDTSQITRELKAQSQQIASVQINKQFPSGVEVVVHEQAPVLLWRSGTQTYVISDDGHAYSQSNQANPALVTIVDSSNVPVGLGQAVVPAQFVEFIKAIQAQLKSLNIVPAQLTVGDTTSEVLVATNAGYSIRLDTTRSANEQIADLKATLDTLKKQNKKPSEYVDLRIPGKVFYK